MTTSLPIPSPAAGQPGEQAAFNAPFAPVRPVKTPADVRLLEATALTEAIRPRSTYELIRNSAQAFGDKTALTFLPSAEPGAPAFDRRACTCGNRFQFVCFSSGTRRRTSFWSQTGNCDRRCIFGNEG